MVFGVETIPGIPLYVPLETRSVVRARLSALMVVRAVAAKASLLLSAVAARDVDAPEGVAELALCTPVV